MNFPILFYILTKREQKSRTPAAIENNFRKKINQMSDLNMTPVTTAITRTSLNSKLDLVNKIISRDSG